MEDKIAQLAAVEHEELDELTSRSVATAARIAALPQPPRRDLVASQQRVDGYLGQAQAALRVADVQNAKQFMDQAEAELNKLEKSLGR